MILYYAMGGGLGHLVRARAVAHTLGLEREITLLTASPYADDRRVTGSLPVKRVPPDLDRDRNAWRSWLERIIADLCPRSLFIDTFPEGILGELAPPFFSPGLPVHHVARRLRSDSLAKWFRPAGPRFDTCYLVEELAAEHHERLQARARVLVPLSLHDPPEAPSPNTQQLCDSIVARHQPFWLVAHSGPAEEVDELLKFAAEMSSLEAARVDLILISRVHNDDLPERTFRYDLYPASLLFPYAQRIVSAGGFNLMRQAAPWRENHVVLPFERRADDQHWRAARR